MSKSVWRLAAELVTQKFDEEAMNACCTAIWKSSNGEAEKYLNRFRYMFRPGSHPDYWWPYPYPEDKKAITARVIALLLMEQIEQDEQRERKP